MADQAASRASFAHQTFMLGPCRIEPSQLRVTDADRRITEISKRQMAALIELAEHHGDVVTRARMHEILCLAEEGHRDRGALSHHVGAIRRALGDSSHHPTYLRTVRGQGYCLLEAPVVAAPRAISPTRGDQECTLEDAATTSSQPPFLLGQGARWRPGPTGAMVALLLFSLVALPGLDQWAAGNRHGVLAPGAEPLTADAGASTAAGIALAALHASASSAPGEAHRASVAALEFQRIEVLASPVLGAAQKGEQLLAVGEALMCLRAWERADQALAQSLAEQRSAAQAPNPLTMARALTGLAQVRAAVGQSIDGSRALLLEATRWLRDERVADRERAEYWRVHAGLMEFGNDLARADALLAESVRLLKNQPTPDREFLLSLRTSRARLATLRGEYAFAEELVAQALASARELFPDGDRRLAPVLTQQGMLLSKRGDYAGALSAHARVVSLLEPYYPDSNSRLIHARLALAGALVDAGDPQAAVALYAGVMEHVRDRDASNVLGLSSVKLHLTDALISAQQPPASVPPREPGDSVARAAGGRARLDALLGPQLVRCRADRAWAVW